MKEVYTAKIKHKGLIYECVLSIGDKEVYIHPKGKRTLIKDFEIIKGSLERIDGKVLQYKTIIK